MKNSSRLFQFRVMRYDWIAVFLAGFFLATGISLTCPCQSSGGAAKPNIHIAMRNTGTRMMLESSVKFQKDTLTWGGLAPDGGKTYSFYNKPLSPKAVVSAKIENAGTVEKVVSLRGWDAVPEATDITISFDVRTDTKEIIVTFLYKNQDRMIDYRAPVE